MTRALAALALTLLLVACGGGGPVTPAPPPAKAPPPPATIAAGHCVARGNLPDPACTPGLTSAAVTQANIATTICVAGYTKTVRPPVSVTDAIKRERMAAYGLAGRDPRGYELDHLISLELGGSPDDLLNLWPEAYAPVPGAHEKDRVENYLHAQICAGNVTLVYAQRAIATDWTKVHANLAATGVDGGVKEDPDP